MMNDWEPFVKPNHEAIVVVHKLGALLPNAMDLSPTYGAVPPTLSTD